MDGETLQQRVSTLYTYPAYEAARSAVTERKALLADALSSELDSVRLRAEADIAEAREEVPPLKEAFRREIAEASQLPAEYRIGLLAVTQLRPVRPTSTTHAFLMLANNMPWFNNDVTPEDYRHPPRDQYAHAAAIGNVLIDTKDTMRRQQRTPVAILSVGLYTKGLPTYADYYVIDRRSDSINIGEPNPDYCYSSDGLRLFGLPTLNATTATFSPVRQRIIKDGSEPTGVSIPHLDQLSTREWVGPELLLIGKRAALFAIKHYAKQQAEHREWEKRNKGVHILDRMIN